MKTDNLHKLRHLNAILRAIHNVNQLIVSEKDRKKLIRKSCKLLIETEGFLNAWIVLFDAAGNYLDAAHAGIGKNFKELNKKLKNGEREYCVQHALENEKVVLITDQKRLCGSCPLHKNHTENDGLAIRLKHGNRLFGTLTVSVHHDFINDPEGHKLLYEIANDLAFALNAIESENIRKKAEKALNVFFDQSLVMLYIADLKENRLIRVNNEVIRITGRSEEELISKPFIEFIHPDDRKSMIKAMSKLAEGKSLVGFHNRHIISDGQIRHFEWTAVPDKENNLVYAMAHDITTRKQTENVLYESEKRYRLLFENNPQPMWVYDLENLAFLAVNNAAVHHYGYTVDEFLSMTIKDIRPAEDIPALLKNIVNVTEGIDKAGVWRHQKKDGTVIDVEITSHTLLWEGRRAEVVLANDITERKRAEEFLKQTERDYRELFESAHDAIMIFTPENELVLDVNQHACKIYGFSRSEFIGMSLEKISANVSRGKINLKKTMDKGYYHHFETVHYRKNGTEIFLEINASVINYKGQKAILSINRDVTERKQAEVALRESEVKFRKLIEQSNDAIYMLFENKFEMINSQFTKLFGYTIDECRAANFDFRKLVAPGSLPIIEKRLERKRKGEQLEPVYEFTAISKDNTEIECEVSVSYIDYKGGIAVQGIIRDITDRKLAEKEKIKLETQLRHAQKLETIGTLAGGIAHDFNNILTPILGYTDMALQNLSQTDPLYQDMIHVLNGANRAKDLVEQILLFSKQNEKERKALSLQSLIKEALKLLRPSIPTTVEIRQQIDNSCGKVLADVTQIHQVIVNLCTNAWQAMEESGGKLTIELKQMKVDAATVKIYPNLNKSEYARLSFIDTGSGMDELTLERIFEPFFTTRAVNKGTGLGLSVVHGIVQSHDGEIIVQSKPGEGAAFHVYLPTIQSEEEISIIKSTEIVGGTEFIMIVDDEATVAEIVKRILEEFGYQTESYESGLDALKAFRENPQKYDLIISDLTMPHLTGLDLADQLHKERPEIPVVIMTGFGDNLSDNSKVGHDIKLILKKPISVKELAITVRKLLDIGKNGEK